jgi:branched-chain amino acid transport system ATP-binding protein
MFEEKGCREHHGGGLGKVMQLLKIERVTKSFGGLVAVQKVSFDVKKGEALSIIGPNGAGKTTLFNVISGFYPPDGGEIFFNGEPIRGLRPDQICKKGLTRTFQIVQPFPELSVLDNVIVGVLSRIHQLRKARGKAMEILESVQMTERAKIIAKKLTLAERKRLEVAKALATEPQVLLMDESMAGLTPTEAYRTLDLIRKFKEKGLTFILIEHVMEIVMNLSDRIIVLNNGEKIAEGSPKEIVSNPIVIEAYLGEGEDA